MGREERVGRVEERTKVEKRGKGRKERGEEEGWEERKG
jgi:hypothetical protein